MSAGDRVVQLQDIMQKIIASRAASTGEGSRLLRELGVTDTRKFTVAKQAQPAIQISPVIPAHRGSTYEDLFADGLRTSAARKQTFLDQITAVQRAGSKPIKPATLIGRQ